VTERPTRVVGRRVLAYIIDSVVVSAIVFGLFLLLTKSYPKAGFKNGIVLGNTRHAFASGSANRTWWIVASVVVAILLLVVLPGLRGWTPGKAVVGIRLVNAEGRPPGILRSLLREILWIVDGLVVNLVGFVTALATKANQRVGDLAAGTYVVRARATGRPIGQLVPEVAGFPPGSQPSVAAPAAEASAAQPGEGSAGQAAGWYGDPQGKARLRWWDGSNWTDHTSA
jgi:uncharacterized RDD family membrane protein YckC